MGRDPPHTARRAVRRDRRPLRALGPHRPRRVLGDRPATAPERAADLVRPRLAARRRARRAAVIASEQRFGLDGDVTVALAGGRQLAVYGSVDRIDRTPTGAGRHRSQGRRPTSVQHDRPTPTRRRRHPVPAPGLRRRGRRDRGRARPATRARAGRAPSTRSSSAGGYQRIGYEFDAEVWAQVAADLQHVVSGVEAGWFPADRAQAAVPLPHRVPVLRTRLARHRRALRRMGAQAARPAPRAVVPGRRCADDA